MILTQIANLQIRKVTHFLQRLCIIFMRFEKTPSEKTRRVVCEPDLYDFFGRFALIVDRKNPFFECIHDGIALAF
jgi:hypothetical protein